MGEFFKGWRRKAGCVTLLAATALTMLWIRSYVIRDQLGFMFVGNEYSKIASSVGLLRWARYSNPSNPFYEPHYLPIWTTMPINYEYESTNSDGYWKETAFMDWRWTFGEFDFGAGQKYLGGELTTRWAVPFWSLTLPLIAISGILLLRPNTRAN